MVEYVSVESQHPYGPNINYSDFDFIVSRNNFTLQDHTVRLEQNLLKPLKRAVSRKKLSSATLWMSCGCPARARRWACWSRSAIIHRMLCFSTRVCKQTLNVGPPKLFGGTSTFEMSAANLVNVLDDWFALVQWDFEMAELDFLSKKRPPSRFGTVHQPHER